MYLTPTPHSRIHDKEILMTTTNHSDGLHLFKTTGLFEERELALDHLRDIDDILFAEGVDYCVMFGTLLGLLRHDDLIPWDDDLDIIIFDIDQFEKKCRHQLEDRGYVVYDDMRTLAGTQRRCGYRIYAKQGLRIPGQTWKFPWLGVWAPDIKNSTMTLPPEKFSYSVRDFFPLERKAFLDFTVSVPRLSEEIVKQYYGSDCMEICMLHNLDHRQYKPTGFPTTKYLLEDVLAYLKENPHRFDEEIPSSTRENFVETRSQHPQPK